MIPHLLTFLFIKKLGTRYGSHFLHCCILYDFYPPASQLLVYLFHLQFLTLLHFPPLSIPICLCICFLPRYQILLRMRACNKVLTYSCVYNTHTMHTNALGENFQCELMRRKLWLYKVYTFSKPNYLYADRPFGKAEDGLKISPCFTFTSWKMPTVTVPIYLNSKKVSRQLSVVLMMQPSTVQYPPGLTCSKMYVEANFVCGWSSLHFTIWKKPKDALIHQMCARVPYYFYLLWMSCHSEIKLLSLNQPTNHSTWLTVLCIWIIVTFFMMLQASFVGLEFMIAAHVMSQDAPYLQDHSFICTLCSFLVIIFDNFQICFRRGYINAASMVGLVSEVTHHQEQQQHLILIRLKLFHKVTKTLRKLSESAARRVRRKRGRREVKIRVETGDSMLCCGRRKVNFKQSSFST